MAHYRVRKPNRVVGGAVHHCASRGAAERRGDWVLGGGAADTDRRSFGARRSHASRSQQHTLEVEPPEGEVPSTVASPSGACRAGGTGSVREWGASHYTGGGDSHRESEAGSQPTRRRYRSARDRVYCVLGIEW